MTDEELQAKWQLGKELLEEMGRYLMSDGGISNYSNATKVLDLLDKFEVVKNEYKALLKEAKITNSTDTVSVPDFETVEDYVKKIRSFAGVIKRSYC